MGEFDMSVLECVKEDNVLYCYDKKDNTVLVYPEKKCKLNQCPEKVLTAFMNNRKDVTLSTND